MCDHRDMANKTVWTKENIAYGLLRFIEEHGHEPTTLEIDACPYLPTSRQIQRKHGGVRAFRETLGLMRDHSVGVKSSERGHQAYVRNLANEKEVLTQLRAKYGFTNVHFHYPLCDDGRTRADFAIFDDEDVYVIDVFEAVTMSSFVGCVNSKVRKHAQTQFSFISPYVPHVIIVSLSKDISQKAIDAYISRRKNPLPADITLMAHDTFAHWFF